MFTYKDFSIGIITQISIISRCNYRYNKLAMVNLKTKRIC